MTCMYITKPQCETTADCLRELVRVMEQFGITDALYASKSRYVKVSGKHWLIPDLPVFHYPHD